MGLFSWITDSIDTRKHERAVEESSGLKKIWLMIRDELPESSFLLLVLANKNNLNLSGVSLAQAQFTDVFYSSLYKSLEQVGVSTDKMFNDLATGLYEDYDKRKIIASRLYGIALAIFMHKAATVSDTIVCKKEVTKFIDASKIEENLKGEIKKSFSYIMNCYDDPICTLGTERAAVSHDLGAVAYSLLDKKLGKNHYADPLYMMAVITAHTITYREIVIIDHNIDSLKKANFLSEQKVNHKVSFTVDDVKYQAKAKTIKSRKEKNERNG